MNFVQVKGADQSKCKRMRFAPWCNRRLGLLERIPPASVRVLVCMIARWILNDIHMENA